MKAGEAVLAQSTESALMLLVGVSTLLRRMGVAERVPMLAREIHCSLLSMHLCDRPLAVRQAKKYTKLNGISVSVRMIKRPSPLSTSSAPFFVSFIVTSDCGAVGAVMFDHKYTNTSQATAAAVLSAGLDVEDARH